ncbi:MAG TPA: A24 family peptidase [Pirellulaceae bacterium]|nr:A24 family peptidase [Pirellulaceae bacterium]
MQLIVFALGLVIGLLVNWGIYSLAWFPRPIGPFSPPPAGAPPRHWTHFLPVAGWFLRRCEGEFFGRGFWIRPLLLELALAAGLALLYGWEMSGRLYPLPALAVPMTTALHGQFLAHALLIVAMTIATFIDFDEQTIPDTITIPGTIAGLVLAALWPESLLPLGVAAGSVINLQVTSPLPWAAWLNGPRGLLLGCAIFTLWCLALIPATCTLRRGLVKGVQFYFASALRGHEWWKLGLLAAVGCASLGAVWAIGGAMRWQALITSLAGLAFGGLLVWSVRIVGRAALHKEAMGFGDVTLMAMIGAFLGWQTTLVVFFLSPVAALVIALSQWLLTGRRDIAFGPYLCLSALFAIVCWPAVWSRVSGIYSMGWIVPALFAACLLLMMAMLMFWRFAEEMLMGNAEGKKTGK